MQLSILVITLISMTVVIVPFYMVVKNSTVEDSDFSSIASKGYKFRSKWFVFLLLLGALVIATTLIPFPYGATASSDQQSVNATGGQWYWKLDKTEFEAGKPILFKVSSADVNHGFAVYSSEDVLVGQTQAMPGYVNELELTLEAGEYTVFCLEYCGLAHHAMFAKFNVLESSHE